MERMLLLLNIFVVGTFWVIANGASPEEMALRNAVASAGPATIILTKDINLTESLPYLASDKVLTVIGRCGRRGKNKCVLNGGGYFSLFMREFVSEGRGSLTLENLVIKGTPGASVTTDGALKVNKVDFVDSNSVLVGRNDALLVTRVTGTITNSQFLRLSTAVTVEGEDRRLDDSVPYTLLTFVNCIFSENTQAMVVRFGAVSIAKSRFTRNVNFFSGAAMYMYYARATITDSLFSKNSVRDDGGAIWMYGTTLKAVNVKFEENVAGGSVRLGQVRGGGAVAIAGQRDEFRDGDVVVEKISRSRATFEKCSFVKNKALNPSGGAFSLDTYADVVFCKSTFSGNTGKNGVASNGYVLDDGEGATKSILTNPVVTIPAVQVQKTTPPLNVVYGKGTCK